MGLWPIQRDKKRFGPATTFYGTVALSFVIPSEAEGSAVPRISPGNAQFYPQTELSSRPPRRAVGSAASLEVLTHPLKPFALRAPEILRAAATPTRPTISNLARPRAPARC